MSNIMNLAPSVETTLLRRRFTFNKSAVGGAAVSGIIGHIAANGDSTSVWVLLFWSIVADDTGICDIFKPVGWDFIFENEI